jgi:hypothetical protein
VPKEFFLTVFFLLLFAAMWFQFPIALSVRTQGGGRVGGYFHAQAQRRHGRLRGREEAAEPHNQHAENNG